MEGILYLLQQLKAMVTPIGISDIIDILIMAFIIYKLIMLIRRTSSGAVAKGVLLFLVALWISSFGLNTVNFLLGKLVEWGGVALVVIFQPEIRRFLEQMGRCSPTPRSATSWTAPSPRPWRPIPLCPSPRPAR